MKATFTALVVAFFLTGCATNPNNSQGQAQKQSSNSTTKPGCPSTGAELDILKTEEQVISCLGQSQYATSKPDGRHTGLYNFQGGLTIVFLYNSEGKVIRYRAYQDSK